MDELRPSASVASGDEHYREEWRCFYAERRRLLIRLFWFAGGLAISGKVLSAESLINRICNGKSASVM
jgi:hypothetical protein